MSSKSGYEIRHTLLMEALNMMMQEWHHHVETAKVNFEYDKSEKRKPLSPIPLPSIGSIIALAEQLNAFVSKKEGGQQMPDPSAPTPPRPFVSAAKISEMAERSNLQDPEIFRKEALKNSVRSQWPEQERLVRQTGRTTRILLAALCWAEAHPATPVYIRGVNRDHTEQMLQEVRALALLIGVDPKWFRSISGLFDDHLIYESI